MVALPGSVGYRPSSRLAGPIGPMAADAEEPQGAVRDDTGVWKVDREVLAADAVTPPPPEAPPRLYDNAFLLLLVAVSLAFAWILLPLFGAVLVPQPDGLSAGAVYAQFDLLAGGRDHLDPGILRELTEDMALAPVLGNDLQPAVLALRPELEQVLESLQQAGALGALVSGSGPTCFALFDDLAAAVTAAATIEGSTAAGLRSGEPSPAAAEGAAPSAP